MTDVPRPRLALSHTPGWADDPGPADTVFESVAEGYGLRYSARSNGTNPPICRLEAAPEAVDCSKLTALSRHTDRLAAWLRDIAQVQQYMEIKAHNWEESYGKFARDI